MLFDCLCGESKVKECYKIGPVSPGTALLHARKNASNISSRILFFLRRDNNKS